MTVKTHMPNSCPKNPQSTGKIISETLPIAIKVPMIDGVTLALNNEGIRHVTLGNKGPLPKPIKKKPSHRVHCCHCLE